MPMLEEGLSRLYWPPLVREAKIISAYPGYEYIMFKSYRELDLYFSQLCGPDWKSEAWAKFWIDQHAASKGADKRERELKRPRGKSTMDSLWDMAKDYLERNPFLSSRKLAYAMNRDNKIISHATAAKFIKRFKKELGSG